MKLIVLLLSLLSLTIARSYAEPAQPYETYDRTVYSECIESCGAFKCEAYPFQRTCCHCFEYSRFIPSSDPLTDFQHCLLYTCGTGDIVTYSRFMKDLIDIRGDGCESCGDDVQDYNINHGYENNPGPKEAADRKLRRGLSYGLGISLPVFVVLSGLLLGYQCYYKPRHQSKKDAKIAAAAAKEEEWVADHDPVTGERMLPLN